MELSRLAASPDRAEQHSAYGVLETEAAAAPPEEQIPACWGRRMRAIGCPMLRADAPRRCADIGCSAPQSFNYSTEELRIAATLRAAELQVSRKIEATELELRIFNLAVLADGLVTGRRKGRQLGLIKLLAEAGKSSGAVYTLDWAPRRGRGIGPEATPARYSQAIKDLETFPSFFAGFASWDSGRHEIGMDH